MSEIRATTISNAAGTGPATLTGQSAAKAWVNFNGTGTIATRDSFNVSSLTDNSAGDYTVNWTSAFSDANYNHAGMGGLTAAALICICQNRSDHVPTASAARYQALFANGNGIDSTFVGVSAFGDLA